MTPRATLLRPFGAILLSLLLPLLANGQSFIVGQLNNEVVRLTWSGMEGEATIERRYPFETDYQFLATVTGNSYRDSIPYHFCADTIRYRLTHESTEHYGMVVFRDLLPTTMPELRVCTVDPQSQRIQLRWRRTPDADLQGYVVCSRDDEEAPWLAVDTLWSPADTSVTLGDDPLQRHHYRIYAFDSCLTASAMTEPFGNLVLEATHNGTTGSYLLWWNAYEGMTVQRYTIELERYEGNQQMPVSHTESPSLTASQTVPPSTTRARLTIIANSLDGLRQARSNTIELLFNIPPPEEPHDTVLPPPPPEVEQETVWIPNAFTPEESTNNRFCLQTSGLRDYQLSLFDRSGRQIYHTDDPAACWDGRLPTGVAAMTGAYVYRLSYLDPHGSPQVITGTVLLIR